MIQDTFKRLIKRATDTILEGRNRTAIVLGTDRKKETKSGFGDGGTNDIDSGTIDIVAAYVGENPDYKNDKSRIYLTGKTNPDEYFGFNRGEALTEKAVVVVFSDNSYIAARNVVKIMTPNAHIIIKSNGDIEIKSDTQAIISAPEITLQTNEAGIAARILTENDICVGTDSSGAPVVSNFKNIALGATINNSNVKIK